LPQIIAHDWRANYIDAQLNGAKAPDADQETMGAMPWTGEQVNYKDRVSCFRQYSQTQKHLTHGLSG